MSIGGKVAWFIGGALFGSAGLRVLSGRDARTRPGGLLGYF